jgi:hypothetical protein
VNNTTPATILVGKGTYDSQPGLKLYSHIGITLLGQTFAPESFGRNEVNITNSVAIIALPGMVLREVCMYERLSR